LSKSAQELKISNAKYTEGTEIERTSKHFMRNLVPSNKLLEILDIGCGTGLNAGYLVEKGHNVTGVDISPVAIQKFRAAGFKGEVYDIADGLPFEDGSFDLVYASEVIEHLADPGAFLAEVFRVTKPNGILLLSTVNSAFWVFRVFAISGYTLTEVQHPGHVRFFSIRSLKKYIKDAGFTSIEMSARHMFMVLSEMLGNKFSFILQPLGFQKEFRFKTKTYFWQLSGFASRANGFFADTLIVKARKPDN